MKSVLKIGYIGEKKTVQATEICLVIEKGSAQAKGGEGGEDSSVRNNQDSQESFRTSPDYGK